MRTLKISALVIGMMAFAMTGCKKDKLTADQNRANTEVVDTEKDINSLTLQSEMDEDALEAQFDESTEEIYMEDDGIAVDYLVEESDMEADASSNAPEDVKRKRIRKNSFVACLRTLDLDKDQIRKIKSGVADYKDCRESAIKRARAIYANVHEKYKKLAQEQIRLVKADKITRAVYVQNIKGLKMDFNKELRQLKLKEKLDAALKNCYTKFLRNLNGVLTARQWAQFIKCYRK